jgi:hypothetical protein
MASTVAVDTRTTGHDGVSGSTDGWTRRPCRKIPAPQSRIRYRIVTGMHRQKTSLTALGRTDTSPSGQGSRGRRGVPR